MSSSQKAATWGVTKLGAVCTGAGPIQLTPQSGRKLVTERGFGSIFQKNVRNPNHHYFIAIHLQFELQYAPNLHCSAFGATELSGKGNTSVPICIAVLLPFVLQYASHLYRNTFGKILVVVVTGMFPNFVGIS